MFAALGWLDMTRKAVPRILMGTEWEDAYFTPLAKDASVRCYSRLRNAAGHTSILAQDPSHESRAAFVAMSSHLRYLGLSAPEVYAADDEAGMMLLEDLGDQLYPRVISDDPSCENSLYSAAIDAILTVSAASAPNLPKLDAAKMAAHAMVVFDWYAQRPAPSLQVTLESVFASYVPSTEALMLRDVHAQNLIWLPDRAGPARVGLLDFQDAMLSSRLYDIVSLLDDARRDVPRDIADALYSIAADRLSMPLADVHMEAAALSLQRNLRILGVFARLCLRDGRANYLVYVPRVWGHIERALNRLGEPDLTAALRSALPQPTPEHLETLENACGTIPKH